MYTLRRLSDGMGDSGPMSTAIIYNDDTEPTVHRDSRPMVGACMMVGSPYARTYSLQDWWQTTPITKILEDTPKRVIFTTRSGSTYQWTCG